VALVAAVAGAAAAWWLRPEEEQPAAALDASAAAALYALTLPDADGRPQPLAQWRGRPLVVNFWATWCLPCVQEMPDLNRVRRAYAPREVEVIGLAIDQPDKVREFRDRHQLALPLLIAGAGGTELIRALGNPSGILPYTLLLDARGQVVQRRLGQIDRATLERWLDAQLSLNTR
jgi:peroxiredoxin